MNNQWHLQQNRIVATRSGEMRYPTAVEIFAAEFGPGKACSDALEFSKPSDALKEICFSRFPAPVAVRAFVEEACIKIEVGVLVDKIFVSVETVADQIIKNGCWYPIHTRDLESARRWLHTFDITTGRPISLGAFLKFRRTKDTPVPVIDEVSADSTQLGEQFGVPLGDIDGLNAQLYPYQREGVRFLRMIVKEGLGCILADEMGLGKTLQIIALAQLERNECKVPILVVSPATLLENWRREFSRFSPNMNVNIHTGARRIGLGERFREWEVVVVSYETLVRDELIFNSINWKLVVIDEAQNIKNPDSARTRVIKSLNRDASIAVTGTPVENMLTDLWSLADFAVPSLLGSLNSFRKNTEDSLEAASKLAPLVGPLILRRTVVDVATDLPERIEVPQPLTMSPQQAKSYEMVRTETLSKFGAAGGLVSITKLRSFCAHADMVEGRVQETGHLAKIRRLLELLDEIFSAGEKALIFCSYLGTTDVLAESIRSQFAEIYLDCIDGRVNVPVRQRIVDSFFEHLGSGALILNPKAAGTGLNITAANHVIHFNPEWNPALTDQASARAFRRKQTRPVTIHHLFYANTVEEAIVSRANFKRELADEALNQDYAQSDMMCIAKALQMSPFQYESEDR